MPRLHRLPEGMFTVALMDDLDQRAAREVQLVPKVGQAMSRPDAMKVLKMINQRSCQLRADRERTLRRGSMTARRG